MTSLLDTAEFNGTQLPVISHNNDYWMISEDIGRALEYSDPKTAIKLIFHRYKDEFQEDSCRINLKRQGGSGIIQKRAVRIFNEEGVMLIMMFSNQPKAKAFRKWAKQVLKAYRHKQLLTITTNYVNEQRENASIRKRACWARANMREEEAAEILGFQQQGMSYAQIAREGLTFRSPGALSSQLRRWQEEPGPAQGELLRGGDHETH